MASLGTLVATIGANAGPLRKGLASAQSSLKGFGSAAVSLLNPITAGFAAVAAAAAGAGLSIYGITQRIAGLAGIADKATQTGLSGKFLQQLGYAADQSGVSMETLTKSIGKMTILIGQNAKAFAGLGLNVKMLRQLSPEQQFLAVAEKIAAIPDAAGRAAAATAVFGKGAIEMTTLFAGGMNDVNALLAEAERLGIGMSDKQLAQAAAADDALQKMWATLGALLDRVAVTLAPAIASIATQLAEWVAPINKALEGFANLADKATWLQQVFATVTKVIVLEIQTQWEAMLSRIVAKTIAAAKQIGKAMLGPAMGAAGVGFGGGGVGGRDPMAERAAAQARLKGLFDQLQPGPVPPPQPPVIPPAAAGGLGDLVGDIAGKAGPIVDGIIDGLQRKQQEFGIKAGAMQSMLSRWFSGNVPTPDKVSAPQGAGAMERGSAEAFRVIAANVMGKQSEEVKATEKQTKELGKKLDKIAAKPAGMVPGVVADFFGGGP